MSKQTPIFGVTSAKIVNPETGEEYTPLSVDAATNTVVFDRQPGEDVEPTRFEVVMPSIEFTVTVDPNSPLLRTLRYRALQAYYRQFTFLKPRNVKLVLDRGRLGVIELTGWKSWKTHQGVAKIGGREVRR